MSLDDVAVALWRLGIAGLFHNVRRRLFKRLPRRPPSLRCFGHTSQEFLPANHVMHRELVEFRFFNSTVHLTGSFWNELEGDPLCLYHLEYMDVVATEDIQLAGIANLEGLIQRWVRENGDPSKWEPYPASRRLVNWMKFYNRSKQTPTEIVRKSIALQYEFVRLNCETHLKANHFFANLKALLFVQMFFHEDIYRSEVEQTATALQRELGEQVLGDYGHFELSTAYHAKFLEDLLDIRCLLDNGLEANDAFRLKKLSSTIDNILPKMTAWSKAMSHRGEISNFSDGGAALHAPLAKIMKFITAHYPQLLNDISLPIYLTTDKTAGRILDLTYSGYTVLENSMSKVILDNAEFGAKVNPGHGHADIGSFEYSFGGARLVSNPGTATYHDLALRNYTRSTAYHSTYVSSSGDSSRLFGKFRVGRTAKIVSHSAHVDTDMLVAEVLYVGQPKPRFTYRHHRQLLLGEQCLTVEDTIVDSVVGEIRFYSPCRNLTQVDQHTLVAALSETASLTVVSSVPIQVEEIDFYADIGKAEPGSLIKTRSEKHLSVVTKFLVETDQ